jgi:transposase
VVRDWRESLVLQRVRLLTEAEPVLLSLPLALREQLPSTSRVLASLNRLTELENVDAGLSAGDRLKLDRLAASRADIVTIGARIKDLDAQIPALLKALGCTLTAIHGIGVVTAMTLLTEIDDPHRFSTEGRFAR